MQAHRLPARNGPQWLLAGLKLFRANPALLSALTFAYLMVVMALLWLPYIGQLLVPLLLPAMSLIMGNGCRAIAQDGPQSARELISGCEEQRTALMRLGVMQLTASLAVLAIVKSLDIDIDPAKPEESVQALLEMLGISLPVLLGFWFAPLLAGWHGVPAFKAIFFSLIACLRNWRALVAFGFTLAVLCGLLPSLLIAQATLISPAFAQGLGAAIEILLLMVVLPAVNASTYLGYLDIFVDE